MLASERPKDAVLAEEAARHAVFSGTGPITAAFINDIDKGSPAEQGNPSDPHTLRDFQNRERRRSRENATRSSSSRAPVVRLPGDNDSGKWWEGLQKKDDRAAKRRKHDDNSNNLNDKSRETPLLNVLDDTGSAATPLNLLSNSKPLAMSANINPNGNVVTSAAVSPENLNLKRPLERDVVSKSNGVNALGPVTSNLKAGTGNGNIGYGVGNDVDNVVKEKEEEPPMKKRKRSDKSPNPRMDLAARLKSAEQAIQERKS